MGAGQSVIQKSDIHIKSVDDEHKNESNERCQRAEKRRSTIKAIISTQRGYHDVAGKQGYHEVRYANGDTYEGQWFDNKKHGQGIYTHVHGDMYTGKFRHGNKHGLGFYSFANGDEYDGSYFNGRRTGRGTYNHANGSTYVGDFKDELEHGHGKYTFPGGGTYEGKFQFGKMEGKGKLTVNESTYYVGEFHDGMIHGSGQVTTGASVRNVEYEDGEEEMVWSKQPVKLKHKDDDIKLYRFNRAKKIIRRAMFEKTRKEMEMAKTYCFKKWKEAPQMTTEDSMMSRLDGQYRHGFAYGLVGDDTLHALNVTNREREFDSRQDHERQEPRQHTPYSSKRPPTRSCSFCNPSTPTSPKSSTNGSVKSIRSSKGMSQTPVAWRDSPQKRDTEERVTYPNGDVYVGPMLSKTEKGGGVGVYRYFNGDVFVGSYKNNLKYGWGRYNFSSSGCRYEGQYREGVMHGRGNYWYSNGSEYSGYFANGQEEGPGTYTVHGKYQYIGLFKQGKMHGVGGITFFDDDCRTYMGHFVHGQLQHVLSITSNSQDESSSTVATLGDNQDEHCTALAEDTGLCATGVFNELIANPNSHSPANNMPFECNMESSDNISMEQDSCNPVSVDSRGCELSHNQLVDVPSSSDRPATSPYTYSENSYDSGSRPCTSPAVGSAVPNKFQINVVKDLNGNGSNTQTVNLPGSNPPSPKVPAKNMFKGPTNMNIQDPACKNKTVLQQVNRGGTSGLVLPNDSSGSVSSSMSLQSVGSGPTMSNIRPAYA